MGHERSRCECHEADAAVMCTTTFWMRYAVARSELRNLMRLLPVGSGADVDDALLDQLEELLLHADLGVKTATALLDRVRREGRGRDASAVREILRDAIAEKLRRVESRDGLALAGKPHVVLVLGVNGSGKTTTIGKLAARHVPAKGLTFKSPEQAQRFLETFSAVCNHFRPRRHRLSAERYRQTMGERFHQWHFPGVTRGRPS